MKTLKKTVHKDDADKWLEMCEIGKMRIIIEFADGQKIMSIVNNDGIPQAIVGERHKFMFEQFVSSKGNGDGLFDGIHQTAGSVR